MIAGAASGSPDRIRVALVGDYPVREDAIHAGGVQSVVHGLAHALARREDVECHVVCATSDLCGSHATHELDRRAGDLRVHFVKRLPLPRLATCHLDDVPRLVRRTRALHPDIVHGQGQDRHGLATVRSGLPCAVTPHGVIFLETPLLVRHSLDVAGAVKRKIMDSIEREVFTRARDMIIISRYLPEVYGRMLTARPHFIENPIDAAFFDLTREVERGRLLFAGTIVPRKRIEDLVGALARLLREKALPAELHDALRLRIVGPFSDPTAVASVRKMAGAEGLESRVTLTGPVSQSDLYGEFRRAEALVLSSREETAPQVIAQALACGLPVVSSNGGGVPHMVADGTTALLFPVGDVAACARQIGRVLSDHDLRKAMTETGRRDARRRFHPDSVAADTVRVYRDVLSLRQARRA